MGNPRGRPFEAGNKLGKGRPKGSRNKATLALQEMLEDSGMGILARLRLMALQGDRTAMRLCLERLLPVRKGRPVYFRLPVMNTVADVAKAQRMVLQQVSKGFLTPEEGQSVSGMIQTTLQCLLAGDLLPRLEKLEQERAGKKPETERESRNVLEESEPPDREADSEPPDRVIEGAPPDQVVERELEEASP